MLRTRIIPALLLRDGSLVKTVRFGSFSYIGDPCNSVRIFNELEVDELLFLDIAATREGRGPNLGILADIATECFMPLGYGGGIHTLAQARSVFEIGFEKVAVNSAMVENPELLTQIADQYGSQAVIASIDVKADFLGRPTVRGVSWGRRGKRRDPIAWAQEAEMRGAGEVLLTSVDREGTWDGFDLDLIRGVSDAVSIPVIAHGGGGCLGDIGKAAKAGASAIALGSMVVFQKKGMGVLINFPDASSLEEVLR